MRIQDCRIYTFKRLILDVFSCYGRSVCHWPKEESLVCIKPSKGRKTLKTYILQLAPNLRLEASNGITRLTLVLKLSGLVG